MACDGGQRAGNRIVSGGIGARRGHGFDTGCHALGWHAEGGGRVRALGWQGFRSVPCAGRGGDWMSPCTGRFAGGGEGCGGASTRGVCEGIGAVPEGPVLLEPQDVVEARGGLVWDAAGCGGKVAPSTCLGVSIDPGEVARASMMDGRLVLEPPSGWNRLIEVPLHPEGAVVDRRRLFLDECKQRSRRHLPQV